MKQMKQKHWKVSVFDKTSEIIKDDTFYTTDTEAYLVFELIDEDFTPDSAMVTVYNIYGTALINVSVEVADGIARYEMPEKAIRHRGGWRAQAIFTKDGEDYTTAIIEFDVGGHLLDSKKPPIIEIENWNSFIAHARELIDDWEQLEEIRQANEQQRESAESARQTTFETNEAERQTEFETNETERGSTFEINESARQANELIREEAEGNRQSTFEEKEVGRQSEFEENEQARESAEVIRLASEVDRVNAEIVRADFYEGFDDELDKKANKQQESWQTATLVNGYAGVVKYRINNFNNLEIIGSITSPTDIGVNAIAAFSLPMNYVPNWFTPNANYTDLRFKFSIATDNTEAGSARAILSGFNGAFIVTQGNNRRTFHLNISIPMRAV